MFEKIRKDEIGIHYKRGDFNKILKAGDSIPFTGEVETYKLGTFYTPKQDIDIMLQNEELKDHLQVFQVNDNEVAVVTKNGNFFCAIGKDPDISTFALWKGPFDFKVKKYDIRNIRIEDTEVQHWIKNNLLIDYAVASTIKPSESALLYIGGEYEGLLRPGTYYFWKNSLLYNLYVMDMRQQQMEVSGQELLTKDKISLRLSFLTTYQIIDAEKAYQSVDAAKQLYSAVQLSLRDYVGGYTLEDILEKKSDLSAYVLEHVGAHAAELGVKLLNAGLRDIILPGDIKEILNQVLIAEKKAQANIITRREETAGVRNMLNTAKLMEENKTLLRLREMEHLEKIAANIDSIEMTSDKAFVKQLKQIADIED